MPSPHPQPAPFHAVSLGQACCDLSVTLSPAGKAHWRPDGALLTHSACQGTPTWRGGAGALGKGGQLGLLTPSPLPSSVQGGLGFGMQIEVVPGEGGTFLLSVVWEGPSSRWGVGPSLGLLGPQHLRKYKKVVLLCPWRESPPAAETGGGC